MDVTRLSLTNVFALRSQAFDEIRRLSAAVDGIAVALADIDVALQTAIDCRSIDDQQALITTARLLASLIERGRA